MSAKPEYFTSQIVEATKVITILMREREQVVRNLESSSAKRRYGETEAAHQARRERQEAEAQERLAALEHKIELARRREREARSNLAAATQRLDQALVAEESRAFARRRPPSGQGPPLLTEDEFRRAQSSVPQWAFFAALTAVTAMAALAVTAGEVSDWVSVTFGVAGLVLPVALGLRANHLAKAGNAISQLSLDLQLARTAGDPPPSSPRDAAASTQKRPLPPPDSEAHRGRRPMASKGDGGTSSPRRGRAPVVGTEPHQARGDAEVSRKPPIVNPPQSPRDAEDPPGSRQEPKRSPSQIKSGGTSTSGEADQEVLPRDQAQPLEE